MQHAQGAVPLLRMSQAMQCVYVIRTHMPSGLVQHCMLQQCRAYIVWICELGRYAPWWQSMSVLAVFASIWTLPEPPILLLLYCLQEELADDVSLVARLCCMLLLDHLLKLLLVPLIHIVILILSPARQSNTVMYSHI